MGAFQLKKFNIGWGLTNLCNMNCKFCYSKETREKSRECNIEDWKNFIDERAIKFKRYYERV